MEHKMLKVGDVRQEGDKYRSTDKGRGCGHRSTDPKIPDDWQPVKTLIGEPILRSDLMHLQFRRPL